ncbi:type II toxin-antitoxin system VapB family antitoxin [Natronosporangium hydrolyticum]|uniref:Type II toxin-antitoxin system VapB family antitoxin n=1 Tax=Natronosporangium hydrolyticum TaxID=2811111 RepID=A0A895YFZ6_9ACTN|nr:type II toxin-antitoxin system VapB family antitoxin [Natronosporangium hydrolyticum]QSB14399.1 type II toxin-antitoxin system VapB family antitoxin [Natronosporangium hydrolyticum]
MKTTVELPDPLVQEAQEVARAEGTTLRALVEDGLRAALAGRRAGARFRLPDASVDGAGLRPEFQDASWDEIRAAIYGDRA